MYGVFFLGVDFFFFFKQKTAYEIGTGDWSSDVCSSDLGKTLALMLRVYYCCCSSFGAAILSQMELCSLYVVI